MNYFNIKLKKEELRNKLVFSDMCTFDYRF